MKPRFWLPFGLCFVGMPAPAVRETPHPVTARRERLNRTAQHTRPFARRGAR